MDVPVHRVLPLLLILGAAPARAEIHCDDGFRGAGPRPHHDWDCPPGDGWAGPFPSGPIFRAEPVDLPVPAWRQECIEEPGSFSLPEILFLLADFAQREFGAAGAGKRRDGRRLDRDAIDRERAAQERHRREGAAAEAQAERERGAAADRERQARRAEEARQRVELQRRAAEAEARRKEGLSAEERRRAEERRGATAGEPDRRQPLTTPKKEARPENPLKPDYPYALPVPGREGMVKVPGAGHDQVIDVRGIPSGTLVKDPASGTKFRVP